MFSDAVVDDIVEIAGRLDVPPATLLAVAQVESGGRAFATVAGRREPLIRFEGHYFDRLLSGEKRAKARALGLASPRAGAVKNPRSQGRRWRLVERAVAIDRGAAYSSVSWGLGQVMGAHWAWLGYGSVDALVVVARSGVAGQVDLMARYIEKAGLGDALRAQDFRTFARGYNGPSYARNRYDTRMAVACREWERRLGQRLPEATAAGDAGRALQFGARGADVTRLQKALTAKGYGLVADGLFGIKTDRALRRFQRDRKLAETGRVGFFEACLLLSADDAGQMLGRSMLRLVSGMKTDSAKRASVWRHRVLSIIRRLA